MNMKKAFVMMTAVAFISMPMMAHAAGSTNTNGNNNGTNTTNNTTNNSSSGSNSNSGSSAAGKATASAYSNGSTSSTDTNTHTTSVTVGNVGINDSTNSSNNTSNSNNRSKSISISGIAVSKNALGQTITNNQSAPIRNHNNPNSINNSAFRGASGVMNVSQESGVNNSSMQTVNVNNSAGLR